MDGKHLDISLALIITTVFKHIRVSSIEILLSFYLNLQIIFDMTRDFFIIVNQIKLQRFF